jgi:hypothetical protein
MIQGPFFANDPVSLTLAAAGLSQTEPAAADAVWQVLLQVESPLMLHTSLGLQAQSFEIFPIFLQNNLSASKIEEYFSAPRIEALLPNYISVIGSPFAEQQVRFELWAAAADTLLGRCVLTNTSAAQQFSMGLRLAGRLIPLGNGSGLNLSKQGFQNFLKGTTNNLTVALMAEGSPKPVISPQTALELQQNLSADESLTVFWRCTVSEQNSENQKRTFAPFPENWDGEMARLTNSYQSRLLSLETPFHDWDCVLLSCQNQANQLLRKENGQEERILFSRQRNIHITHAQAAGRVADLTPGLALPDALELTQEVHSLLPGNPTLAQSLAADFIAETMRRLSNNANKLNPLPFPCLANLAQHIFQYTDSTDFLKKVYPDLKAFTLAWFSPANDRDQDGWPEWASLNQTGLHHLTRFDLLDPSALPARITTAENIGLAVLLQKELEALSFIADKLADPDGLEAARHRLGRLQLLIQEKMSKDPHTPWWDRDCHQSAPSAILVRSEHFAGLPAELALEPAGRLHFQMKSSPELRKPVQMTVVGSDESGEECRETIAVDEWLWLPGYFYAATKCCYRSVSQLLADPPASPDLAMYRADLSGQDITAWLGRSLTAAAGFDEASAGELDAALLAFPYGLPEMAPESSASAAPAVNVGWNFLIIRALLQAGERTAAFELFSKLMNALIRTLKQEHTLFESFDAVSALPLGARSAAAGLLPAKLLLELAGVTIFNPNKVSVAGENPLPWPLRAFYRGLTIERDGKNCTITFPDGSTRHHFGAAARTYTPQQNQLPQDNQPELS